MSLFGGSFFVKGAKLRGPKKRDPNLTENYPPGGFGGITQLRGKSGTQRSGRPGLVDDADLLDRFATKQKTVELDAGAIQS